MDTVVLITSITIPALIVFLTSYFLLKNFLKSESERNYFNSRLNNQKISLPLRLQAYERMTLLLERISLQNLILRIHRQGMSSRTLQSELVKNIRAEFDHNIAQQIYLNPKTWEAIKTAKEETIKAINIASTRVNEDGDSMDLVNVLFEIIQKLEHVPTDIALRILKEEARMVI